MKTIPTLDPSGGDRDPYQTILIDTPVGPYFESFLQSIQSEDGNVDVAQVLSETDLDILKMEADFAVLSVTLNALNTPLGSAQQLADRNALYPNFGYLFPEGAEKVRKAFNETTVRAALEPYANYLKLYDACKEFYESDSKKVAT